MIAETRDTPSNDGTTLLGTRRPTERHKVRAKERSQAEEAWSRWLETDPVTETLIEALSDS
jgi:hypothetical protein